MSSALLLSHDTSRDTTGRHEPHGARHDDESTRPVRDRVDVAWMLEPGPGEAPPRSEAACGIVGVLE